MSLVRGIIPIYSASSRAVLSRYVSISQRAISMSSFDPSNWGWGAPPKPAPVPVAPYVAADNSKIDTVDFDLRIPSPQETTTFPSENDGFSTGAQILQDVPVSVDTLPPPVIPEPVIDYSPSIFTSVIRDFLVNAHDLTGMPWWATIVVATAGMRCVHFVFADRASTRLELNRVTHERKGAELTIKLQQNPRNMKAREELGDLMHTQPSPLKNLPPLLFGVTLNAWFFFGLRNCRMYPPPGFTSEGLLWFPDLAAKDTTFGLPVIAGVLFALPMAYEFHKNPPAMPYLKYLPYVAMPFPVIINYFMELPSACFLLMVVSALGAIPARMHRQRVLLSATGNEKKVQRPKFGVLTPTGEMKDASKLSAGVHPAGSSGSSGRSSDSVSGRSAVDPSAKQGPGFISKPSQVKISGNRLEQMKRAQRSTMKRK